MNRREHLAWALGAALLPAAGMAQDAYPTKPVQIIVPFPPGGAVDIVGRKIAEKWKTELGQPVVVVNRPGANGVVAWQSLMALPPDGHHIFAAAGQGLGFVHKMNSKITSTFLEDFVPVGSYGNYPLVILVNKDLPVNNLKELAAYATKNPKRLSYGTTGVGSGGHFLFELYKSTAKVADAAMPPSHYAGIAPELTALVGNHIQVAIMPLTSLAAQQIDTGAIRALAVTADNRSPFRKEIPTVVEQGFPELVAKDYISYWVPAKTPAAAVRRLADATRKATQDPEISKLLTEMFFEVEFLDGAATRKQFEVRAAQFEPLIKKLDIKLQ
ncbi:tripartite tricarboxylate transporter substrate binding protein [Ramlibacter sp. AW1]|uniref:Tripartite tricarboxylate transporter substrate binding protein n=1 Tax=Ramlibacter aurantiacus TaxID=2801330 RepID=A0A937D3M5_9BURK|nr:tripartite tricarboxylate transporter substrate binding protein [Ramlibacter aurantiacus]MBL0420875.1 tripartite tricarboxylate transporter substrate binding protein [Ramlibacter aurantiacus]